MDLALNNLQRLICHKTKQTNIIPQNMRPKKFTPNMYPYTMKQPFSLDCCICKKEQIICVVCICHSFYVSCCFLSFLNVKPFSFIRYTDILKLLGGTIKLSP